jgi:hypothetical protein
VEDEADDFVAGYEGAGLEVFRDYDMCVIECSIRLAGVMYATLLTTQINVGSRSSFRNLRLKTNLV